MGGMENELEEIRGIEPPGGERGGRGLALRRKAGTIGTFLVVIWTVWVVNALMFRGALLQYGLVPRSVGGLLGVVVSPFLHANLGHVWSNTLGFVLLGGLLILRSEEAFWAVTIVGTLTAGVGTWVIGRGDSVHVGASGVIFAYFGYLLSAGIFERRVGAIILSAVVFFVWGGLLWSAVPLRGQAGVSWEEHLCGLAGGVMTAWLLAGERRKELQGLS
jgi:membrane associated rhomboid family serine protease